VTGFVDALHDRLYLRIGRPVQSGKRRRECADIDEQQIVLSESVPYTEQVPSRANPGLQHFRFPRVMR
jgi:hypothetical protein